MAGYSLKTGRRMRMRKKKPVAKTAVDKSQNKMIRKLARDLKPEIKHTDTSYTANDILGSATNAVVALNLCNPAQGNTQITRIGDEIKCVGIWLRGCIAASNNYNWVRIMVVHDRRMFLTALAGADLLANYSTTNLSDYNAHSTYQEDIVNTRYNRGKSVDVLYDKVLYVGPNTNSDQLRKSFSFIKTFKTPKKVNFSGGNTATGQIFCYVFPGNQTVAGNNPSISFSCTAFFQD